MRHTGKTTGGIAVTSAGNLPSRCIIHLATPATYDRKRPASKNWEERIIKCLEQTESMKMKSITFPLLGTGRSCAVVRTNVMLFHRHIANQRSSCCYWPHNVQRVAKIKLKWSRICCGELEVGLNVNATHLWCGAIFSDSIITNFLLILTVK